MEERPPIPNIKNTVAKRKSTSWLLRCHQLGRPKFFKAGSLVVKLVVASPPFWRLSVILNAQNKKPIPTKISTIPKTIKRTRAFSMRIQPFRTFSVWIWFEKTPYYNSIQFSAF
ncbi:hypothetical protein MPN_206 [Mycoplasmoides pneumoniae M129]|uniref:Uncharacterized protein MPN_206 n=2 Tax=Mycoplasmoides pneumoniae TaxID=2104 RepID=Y206_MYCPN|nr:hypothetical protein [Mycoplasmoides pneumoniae]P75570.1 RecName: Full=Uncharacterized protein MPN_206 [Mycoplasmoides pneumoniae M129]AAB96273.1 hypothetical protein MPN_206 [Mycoplasmoides pneumoniae M129]CAG7571085.1 Uncharacterized protein MPN_206 [Mycoplasmoides pneumoniae M129]BAL21780.1 hypothetical protein MPNA2060 [Mycoplasmoides pneumoniae 309]BAV19693.1 hypothetical protein MPNB_2060 [Mycoplasmoides pneumoniae]BAV20431.1 hypothetical protein MPNC_2060 [Mycoplasmoides pneumoniae]